MKSEATNVVKASDRLNIRISRRQANIALAQMGQMGLFACLGGHAVAKAGTTGQSISVRNAQLRLLKELRTKSDLAEFYKFFGSRQPTGKTTNEFRDWSYTIDIISGGAAQRWAYQNNGYMARVASTVQAVYQLRNHTVFNELIGAPKY